uniref:NADH-ubiquinone oxidoreductase chain 4L n=1 Tax=Aspidoscelis scalaris TaxID=171142 RepID=A0A977TMJ3_9SAUR|nr:NADH dehydrogenase subunit 4L [Aspidoscelis gularis]YP_010531698.1 NADH dehydrogenase subunit 4L [Aspidoscelis scalaris]YP_010531724.1 NADH dehydrogenase subunit 4L [Aspidoscelis laredoensis]UXX18006.1 NADH dehydrogenase subunit 4L [Aspidoscelis gularis]UXX18019.1 NADH dehydrogenase subunit 4L [Aspidoscelis gularis]UXX18032.1 NADH dehydrogenase subunit 4L [Aspidoscelis gularis]UXX18422.1 NADH dehydrogenase subunit 4L [Aspidoscelis scalaris]UXX18604.1 NADH dehydrogenase subunit 4L [Aspidos
MTATLFMINISFTLSLLGLAIYRTHLISALLCIENMALTLFLMFTALSTNLLSTTLMTTPITLLTFAACEASTGLALMIATARTHGSDHLKTFNLLQC